MNRLKQSLWQLLIAALALTCPLAAAGADKTSGGLPWNEPLELLKDNLTGPTATVIILIALAFGFVVWSFADDNRGLFRAFKALIAMAVVGGAASGLLGTLGIDGAML